MSRAVTKGSRTFAIHRYNGLLGHVAMAKAGMRAVQDNRMASERAQVIANAVERWLAELDKELRTNRQDPA